MQRSTHEMDAPASAPRPGGTGLLDPARPHHRGTRPRPGQRRRRGGWRVPAALVALSVVPVLAGGLRLTDMAGLTEATSDTARFLIAPVPVIVHIVTATAYSTLGALQFSPSLRRRPRGWHRVAGRLLVPLGLAVALSGLWLTLFLPRPPGDGDLLTAFRLVFGSAMAMAIVLGVAAVRRRDIAAHGAWMTRGYAIGLGAGTQAFTLGLGLAIAGEPDELGRARSWPRAGSSTSSSPSGASDGVSGRGRPGTPRAMAEPPLTHRVARRARVHPAVVEDVASARSRSGATLPLRGPAAVGT
jgi:uncharacterized membrane protein